MKILVTGASGFLGGRLCEELANQKLDYVPVYRKNQPKIQHSLFIHSLNAQTDWSNNFTNVDYVIHCAARVHVMNELESDPLALFREVNVDGTLNLARQAAANGVKRFIFISSIKVNGNSTLLNEPFRPEDKAEPQDPYGISKAEAEYGLREIEKDTEMEVVIIRPPLVYGPGVKANFAAIMKLTSLGIPLPFGSITKNKRSMVYIDNLVDLIITCVFHPKAAGETFLVSDNDDLSTARMIKTLSFSLGKKGWMLPIPVKLFENLGRLSGKSEIIERLCGSLQVDISKTIQLLNWQPPTSVKDAFIETTSQFMFNNKNK